MKNVSFFFFFICQHYKNNLVRFKNRSWFGWNYLMLGDNVITIITWLTWMLTVVRKQETNTGLQYHILLFHPSTLTSSLCRFCGSIIMSPHILLWFLWIKSPMAVRGIFNLNLNKSYLRGISLFFLGGQSHAETYWNAGKCISTYSPVILTYLSEYRMESLPHSQLIHSTNIVKSAQSIILEQIKHFMLSSVQCS